MPRVENETFYSAALQKYGLTCKALHWNSEQSQNLRFKILLSLVRDEISTCKVVDIGCGFGDLYHFMKSKPLQYIGIDVMDEMVEEAKKRKTTQYLAEGFTFLALIILGAVFVFRATRRQLRLSQQQQNFMMAVTHELKTPIAITQLNLETLQKRKLEEEKQQKLISNTLQEANRLNTLCNNILLASQLDSGLYSSQKQEINLSDLVEVCIDDFANRYPQRKITEKISESIYINGETLLLQMLVNNLIENALKYSPKDSVITVTLQDRSGTSWIYCCER